jgi:hypothetical protein
MIQAFNLTSDSSYLKAAITNLDYLLGRNATTYSFVTGYGNKTPMHPHHRPSEGDNVVDPIPGLLVGGPSPRQEDGCSGYPSNLPAKSYLDDVCSYASNEICINWNAPLAYLAAAIEAIKSPTGIPIDLTVSIAAPNANAIYNTSDAVNIKATTSVSDGNITKVEFFANKAKIGSVTSAPFEISWTNMSAGVYQLEAKAVSDNNDFQYSTPVTIFIQNANPEGRALFVVGSTDLNSGDRAVRDFLISHNYQVTLQNDDDAAPYDTLAKDIILVSSTVIATNRVKNELVSLPIPTVVWEMTLFDDFGWTAKKLNTDYGTIFGSTIKIVNDIHPLAGGLSEVVPILTTAQNITWGKPTANAKIIATVNGDTTKATIFAFAVNDLMINNVNAPARRVAMFLSDESAANLTNDGWTLFELAVKWAQINLPEQGSGIAENGSNIPASFSLGQNYPNPFNPMTQICYSLHKNAAVSIKVYNAMGQWITSLVDKNQTAGSYRIEWNSRDSNGRGVSNGLYLYQMRADDFTQTRKMVLMK